MSSSPVHDIFFQHCTIGKGFQQTADIGGMHCPVPSTVKLQMALLSWWNYFRRQFSYRAKMKYRHTFLIRKIWKKKNNFFHQSNPRSCRCAPKFRKTGLFNLYEILQNMEIRIFMQRFFRHISITHDFHHHQCFYCIRRKKHAEWSIQVVHDNSSNRQHIWAEYINFVFASYQNISRKCYDSGGKG